MHETRTNNSNAITGTLPKAGMSTSGGSLRTLPVGLCGGVEIGSRGDYDIRRITEGREDGPTEAERKGVVSIMTITWIEAACEHGIHGQCLECLLLVEERLEELETVCHHAERLPNGECDVCEDNDVQDFWLHRNGTGFYIQ